MTTHTSTDTAIVDHPDYDFVKQLVIDHTGLHYLMSRDQSLLKRLRQRLNELQLKDLKDYRRFLDEEADIASEINLFARQLTIGETHFFRHAELFDALKDHILPELIDRNRASRSLRIWSAGCSIGAEPSSVAILLQQELARQIADWRIEIVGTDINQQFLDTAMSGRYDEWALRGTPEHIRTACFERVNEQWRLRPRYRQMVRYQAHNLIDDPFPSTQHNLYDFDLILCRNVFIYFTPSNIAKLADRFYECLTDGGYLAVGHSELNQQSFRRYRTVHFDQAIVYHRGAAQQLHASPGQDSGAGDYAANKSPVTEPSKPIESDKPSTVVAPTRQQPVIKVPEATTACASLDRQDAVRALADSGRFEEAETICNQWLDSQPMNPRAHLLSGLIAQQADRYGEADQAFKRAVYLDNQAALSHYLLGLNHYHQGKYNAAQHSFRNAHSLLHQVNDKQHIPGMDDMTVVDLRRLVTSHLQLLDSCRAA